MSIVGGPGVNNAFSLLGLSGTITINTGNQIKPGQYELSVPTKTLDPLNIFGLATACVFLQEDPYLPGSGIAGVGLLNCSGGGVVDAFPSPNLFVHQDHCTDGVSSCDSGTAFLSECPSALGPGRIDPVTGICVPAAPTDAACSAWDALTGTSAKLEGVGDQHPDVCNSPIYSEMGSTAYTPGDSVLVLTAAIEIRAHGDPCLTGPGTNSISVRGPVTTGTVTSTLMDAFPSLPDSGKVQVLVLTGAPLTCVTGALPQHGDPVTTTSGASFVIAGSALDIVVPAPLSGTADFNAGLVLKGQ